MNHLLFRCVHINLCKHWKDKIEPNFITFPSQERDYEFSVDWSKYTSPEETIARKYLIWYARKNKIFLQESVKQLELEVKNQSEHGFLMSNLNISQAYVSKFRKIYGVLYWKIRSLLETIKSKDLPLRIEQDPIKD